LKEEKSEQPLTANFRSLNAVKCIVLNMQDIINLSLSHSLSPAFVRINVYAAACRKRAREEKAAEQLDHYVRR